VLDLRNDRLAPAPHGIVRVGQLRLGHRAAEAQRQLGRIIAETKMTDTAFASGEQHVTEAAGGGDEADRTGHRASPSIGAHCVGVTVSVASSPSLPRAAGSDSPESAAHGAMAKSENG
jgi:hypothetical protein